MSHKSEHRNETVKCPFCGKENIDITRISEYYGYHAARAFGKVKQIPVVHPERIEIHNKCPKCDKTKSDIREALESGAAKLKTHEERLKRLQAAGLPTKIMSKRG